MGDSLKLGSDTSFKSTSWRVFHNFSIVAPFFTTKMGYLESPIWFLSSTRLCADTSLCEMGDSLMIDSFKFFCHEALFLNFITTWLKWGILSLQSGFWVQLDKMGESLGPATREKSIWISGSWRFCLCVEPRSSPFWFLPWHSASTGVHFGLVSQATSVTLLHIVFFTAASYMLQWKSTFVNVNPQSQKDAITCLNFWKL